MTRRVAGLLTFTSALAVGALRMFHLAGNPLHADGGLVLFLGLIIATAVLLTGTNVSRETSRENERDRH